MPAFGRSGGAWVESVPKARPGGAWTDEDDQLFARDGEVWSLIYPDPAAAGDLLPVESLAVTAGPDHNSVTIGRTNPTQPTLTPTNVQVRLATLGAVWTEFTYPITSTDWAALDASTEYLAQVRLVVRTLGIVTATSPIRSVGFTTTAAPVGAPAPDPGGTGGDTLFPIGVTTGGTPSPPSTVDGCWWEWKIEILSQTAFSWISTGITGTADGDAANISYDAAGLDPTRVYQLCIREACDTTSDGVADTFEDWMCGDPFPGLGDWGAVCGGFTDSDFSSLDAVADAVYQFPRFCKNTDGDQMVLTDAISGVEVAKGPGFSSFFTDIEGEHGVLPLSTVGPTLFPPTMVAPIAALNTVLAIGQDATIVARFKALSSFALSNGRVTPIASWAGSTVIMRLTESVTGFTPSVTILLESGAVTLTGSEITLDDALHTLALRWDDDGDKELLVDAVVADTDSSAESWYTGFEATAAVITSAAPLMANMQQAGWNRLLTDDELVSLGETRLEMTLTEALMPIDFAWTMQPVTGAMPFDINGTKGANASGTGGSGVRITGNLGVELIGERLQFLRIIGASGPNVGGNALDLRRTPFALSTDDRLMSAAGGGASPTNGFATAGGHASHPDLTSGPGASGVGTTGGSPGTVSAGGAAGLSGGSPDVGANDGQFGTGGTNTQANGGAGGGAGWYGGGAGASNGGNSNAGAGGGFGYVNAAETAITDEVYALTTATACEAKLTATQYLHPVCTSQLEDGPEALWPFNEMGGASIVDYTGVHTVAIPAGYQNSPNTGRIHAGTGARRFDPSSVYEYHNVTGTLAAANVPKLTSGIADLLPGDPTGAFDGYILEMWVHAASGLASNSTQLAFTNAADTNPQVLKVAYSIGTGDISVIFNATTRSVTVGNDDAWHHVMLRIESDGTVHVYVDGAQVGATFSYVSALTPPAQMVFGQWNGATNIVGSLNALANVAIYQSDWYTAGKVTARRNSFDP